VAEKGVHPVSRVLIRALRYVAVCVGRERDLTVSEPVHDGPKIREHQACGLVTKIMETHSW
jgi:hypothetical protein